MKNEFANTVVNKIDPSGLVTSSDCLVKNPDSLSDDTQIRCDYARRFLQLYPESRSLDYWLRFSVEGLREAYRLHRDGDPLAGERLAVVPLDFTAVSGDGARDAFYQDLTVRAFRNLEQRIGRPPTFTEVLAIIITGEVSPILDGINLPASSECGRTPAQFQALTSEAALRYFHGQCRRDGAYGDLPATNMSGTTLTGQCGPGRLIGKLLANVQSFYDEMYVDKNYTRWISTARALIAVAQPGGQACEGTAGAAGANGSANAPFIWGNTPSEQFPANPPRIGAGHVIDYINRVDGNYEYFVIQSSSACPASGDRCGNKTTSQTPDPLFIVADLGLQC